MVLRLALVLAAAAVLVTEAYAVGTWRAEAGLEERRALVAERGAEVMPFDLEQTTHLFAPRRDDGVQSVTADDPGDAVQTARIREHLREEATAFRRGEFADPGRDPRHSDAGAGRAAGGLRPDRDRVPAGGRLRYTTSDPELVAALHAWFDAQLGDHGEHATRG